MSTSASSAAAARGGKRKKHHDKDKYYTLAKEQGYRSRAAFKLIQINKKYQFLQNARVCIDLCAAPGGWCQVAAKTMKGGGSSQADNVVLGVDLLPIRKIRNVETLVADITTESCRALIKRTLANIGADVVLCDGAPNVGASYDKDSYEQNELVLLALKCATEHLKRGGTFVTKVYRSADYNSLLWVLKQFFKRVEAVKPASSRAQSAEIFLVCLDYLEPTKIDPRILDPKHVFEQISADDDPNASGPVNIFHKNYGVQKRQRQGYDFEKMDAAHRRIQTITEFVNSDDPIKMLSDLTGFRFDASCDLYLKAKATTDEIKLCLSDLKVLGKSDFKSLLVWRLEMQELRDRAAAKDGADEDGTSMGDEAVDSDSAEGSEGGSDSDSNSGKEENKILDEIDRVRLEKLRKKKREKKKEKEKVAKLRQRKAYGMHLESANEHALDGESVFSLAQIKNKKGLERVQEVELSKESGEVMGYGENGEDSAVSSSESEDDVDPKTGYSYRLDRELDNAYDVYLKSTKNTEHKNNSKLQKRSKKLLRQKASDQAHEDLEMMEMKLGNEAIAYANLLNDGEQKYDGEGGYVKDDDASDSDSDSDSEEEGGDSDSDSDDFGDNINGADGGKKPSQNPLIHTVTKAGDARSVKAQRWFSNPLFDQIKRDDSDDDDDDDDEDGGKDELNSSDDNDSSDDDGDNDDDASTSPESESRESKKQKIDPEAILNSMPKTDKQKRHEKRLKARDRNERKKAKKTKESDEGFEVVRRDDAGEKIADNEEEDGMTKSEVELAGMSEKQRKRVMEARRQLKAGLRGNATNNEKDGFEIVPASKDEASLPVYDDRTYDSENEDYDSDDHARTLALGTMMLRKTKAKALVDASYNRFSNNDPQDLPDWFVDDETRNYRPQLPVPPALVAKMKAQFQTLASKPIAKVAEARARKQKRASVKLKAAKKKAEAVANNADMTESAKLKAVSKALRGQGSANDSKPGKTYVVAKKGSKGAKGVKLVDKRQKSDKRGMKRAASGKRGKKGGMTGHKRRRNHS